MRTLHFSLFKTAAALATLLLSVSALAADKTYTLASPDGRLSVTVSAGSQLTYTVSCGGIQLLASSPVSMTLDGGRAFGPGRGGPKKNSRPPEGTAVRFRMC